MNATEAQLADYIDCRIEELVEDHVIPDTQAARRIAYEAIIRRMGN